VVIAAISARAGRSLSPTEKSSMCSGRQTSKPKRNCSFFRLAAENCEPQATTGRQCVTCGGVQTLQSIAPIPAFAQLAMVAARHRLCADQFGTGMSVDLTPSKDSRFMDTTTKSSPDSNWSSSPLEKATVSFFAIRSPRPRGQCMAQHTKNRQYPSSRRVQALRGIRTIAPHIT
jgi:hypothetical protein